MKQNEMKTKWNEMKQNRTKNNLIKFYNDKMSVGIDMRIIRKKEAHF